MRPCGRRSTRRKFPGKTVSDDLPPDAGLHEAGRARQRYGEMSRTQEGATEREFVGLIPDDPAEIRRIYLELSEEKRRWIAKPRGSVTELAPLLPEPGLQTWDVLGLFVTFCLAGSSLAGLEGGLAVLASLGATTGAVAITASIAAGLARAALKDRFSVEKSPILATGPLSFVALMKKLVAERSEPQRPEPSVEVDIDVDSLDVLEPVAREIARPILERARRPLVFDAADLRRHNYRLDLLASRITELRGELEAETDPTWQRTIRARIADLEEEIERERTGRLTREEKHAEILRQADEIEDTLDRLARRRRLLAEIAADRQNTESVPSADTGLDDLRVRLASLGESLQAQDAGTDRARAELEMRRLETGGE